MRYEEYHETEEQTWISAIVTVKAEEGNDRMKEKKGVHSMKKHFLISAMSLFLLSACSGSGSPAAGAEGTAGGAAVEESPAAEEVSTRIADDTSILSMSFSKPDSFEDASRFSEFDPEGNLKEKDIAYSLGGDEVITYSVARDMNLSELVDTSTLETKEINGISYFLLRRDNMIVALYQKDSDLMMIEREFAGEIDDDAFFELVSNVTYTDNTETILDDVIIEGMKYSGDDAGVFDYGVTVTEDPEGNLKEKGVIRYYGADKDNVDYRIVVMLETNTTIAELAGEDQEAEEITVNGITYQAYNSAGEAEAYDYYYQSGSNVYEIRNAGKPSFFSTTRSEESFTAFHAFVENVTFE